MNYTLKHIKIKSNWFDSGGKFSKMGIDAFLIYLTLFRFRLHNQDYEYTFLTSISYIRKETKLSKQETFDCLRLLKKFGIIDFENVTRWDRFLNTDKTIPDDRILHIVATDVPNTTKETNDKNITYDKPVTESDYYISVDLNLFDVYKSRGLNHSYYPVYCLLKKWQNNIERKSFMSIQKMADCIGYDKDYLNKLIREMNRQYILYSDYRNNGKGSKYFEHHLMNTLQEETGFLRAYQEQIEKNIKKWDKKKRTKIKR
ncbi:hypothetical protein [Paenibacillus polymyxa]|uniref:hypothetical protein n=1 Tax=Paenibacillus polymyxa TaxID=1406 RepID=UPI002023F2A3|nr:hypothetical protein [Paenibacillus polymyxa]MDU8675352.1 hypothetical protein [Paenibacillus polymyxa]MDU8700259.1 hypothetical protein [Paenibacillus polymyxa]URJ54876.1 hypothetical protein MF623_004275 [Paenibacillus polymyxa]URJ66719.1 hypothetical protein MF620_001621 [Paenibacillus polymyxa]URJ69389.1 hypothetical protein MF624_004256 [Paenibacillus polymyxa]